MLIEIEIKEIDKLKHFEKENKLLRELIMKLVQESNLNTAKKDFQIQKLTDENNKLKKQNIYLEKFIN